MDRSIAVQVAIDHKFEKQKPDWRKNNVASDLLRNMNLLYLISGILLTTTTVMRNTFVGNFHGKLWNQLNRSI